jgi:hypothetical protein
LSKQTLHERKAAFEMSSEREKNEVEQKEAKLKKITEERDKLSKTIESWDKTIEEAKVAYLGATDKAKAKMVKQIKDLEGKRKEDLSRLKKAEKKVAQAAVDFLNFFSN